jgi:hypothetical protein
METYNDRYSHNDSIKKNQNNRSKRHINSLRRYKRSFDENELNVLKSEPAVSLN